MSNGGWSSKIKAVVEVDLLEQLIAYSAVCSPLLVWLLWKRYW